MNSDLASHSIKNSIKSLNKAYRVNKNHESKGEIHDDLIS